MQQRKEGPFLHAVEEERLRKVVNGGRVEKLTEIREETFLSHVVITKKSVVPLAQQSDHTKTMHMPKLLEMINQISINISLDRSKPIFILAFGQ